MATTSPDGKTKIAPSVVSSMSTHTAASLGNALNVNGMATVHANPIGPFQGAPPTPSSVLPTPSIPAGVPQPPSGQSTQGWRDVSYAGSSGAQMAIPPSFPQSQNSYRNSFSAVDRKKFDFENPEHDYTKYKSIDEIYNELSG